jgi:hypothetical protein
MTSKIDVLKFCAVHGIVDVTDLTDEFGLTRGASLAVRDAQPHMLPVSQPVKPHIS